MAVWQIRCSFQAERLYQHSPELMLAREKQAESAGSNQITLKHDRTPIIL